MVGFGYLNSGLYGMARAHRANAMAGHLGAALVSGYFIGEELFGIGDDVHAAIERELDRIIRGEESIWYDAAKARIRIPELFAPFPGEDPRPELIPGIAAALSRNIDATRESGHNVIFASLAIRAFHDHPDRATPSIVGGIQELVALFDDAGPGQGYYGKERSSVPGNEVTLPEVDFPPYDSEATMANVVIDRLIRHASEHRRGFGGLIHVIDHAAALIELSQFGFAELARRGWAGHRNHVRLWETLPDLTGELGKLKRSQHDPRTLAYWKQSTSVQWSAWLTHRIKALYGFSILQRFVNDPERRRKAEEAFRFLMA